MMRGVLAAFMPCHMPLHPNRVQWYLIFGSIVGMRDRELNFGARENLITWSQSGIAHPISFGDL